MIKWDEWRGSLDGRPTMWIKRLIKLFGYRIDIHKFVKADDPDCLHSHPATAIRIVLWGGYDEQVDTGFGRVIISRGVGHIGIVRPDLVHRIHSLHNGKVNYSLWLRGPITHKTRLVGSGWGDKADV